jgi:hypothetical protein
MVLNLNDALLLYEKINLYLPDHKEYDSGISYMRAIIQNIKSSGNGRIYLEILEMFSDKSIEELIELETDNLLKIFSDGLRENKILQLAQFGEFLYG